MILKKINAGLGLLSILFMILHIGFTTYSYLTMYYNPKLKNILSYPFMILVIIHVILGIVIFIRQRDGKSHNIYPKNNFRTILQRLTAILIIPLLILHINIFSIMKSSANNGSSFIIYLMIIAELLFFGSVITHVVVSFSNAFITLGLITSKKVQKIIDIIMYVLGAIAFVITVYAVITLQVNMFLK